jgi:hypothetical protein
MDNRRTYERAGALWLVELTAFLQNTKQPKDNSFRLFGGEARLAGGYRDFRPFSLVGVSKADEKPFVL